MHACNPIVAFIRFWQMVAICIRCRERGCDDHSKFASSSSSCTVVDDSYETSCTSRGCFNSRVGSETTPCMNSAWSLVDIFHVQSVAFIGNVLPCCLIIILGIDVGRCIWFGGDTSRHIPRCGAHCKARAKPVGLQIGQAKKRQEKGRTAQSLDALVLLVELICFVNPNATNLP